MKLASFQAAEGVRPGVVVGDQLVDLAAADRGLHAPWAELLERGELDRVSAIVASGEHRIALDSVRLAPPVQPRKFFAIGLNYADHVAESGQPMPEHMTVFIKASSCVTGPYDPIQRPAVSDFLDYEGELGFVIGRRCRHVKAQDAADVIAGYVIVDDVSVRDWQIQTPQWSLAKSFDTHGPIGPWITTPDELEDPHALGIRTYVNGELRQQSSTDQLIFDCFRQVEILSQACTLEPGDVVATGTPAGIAAAMEGRPWLKPGDRVRVEIDGLGAIENEVVQERITTGERVLAA
ncbi:fumarylacetoacetate hydrolase family protein [Solirubrobacter ginsenosidimutans]|uniref:Fumarylacetoacetate hydrolase family protein n=1 Tax=Solirubrobacter ginsenosidimutans TaxID=490573 RepID=A0A9X3N1D7_9ACTN|nr:fumarylacetoacetate hydrolase family protein [Solirubrobacter ginsenosidimutans]MDA0166851.1 fumarylacetoacetate hydrolase family protein [Solirubrobacter ginsenosidimutans]